MQISRRNALLGATAAGAAGVPGAVQGDDAHLEALHAEWRAAEERLVNACEAADAAESRIRDQLPERPLITMGRDWTTKDLFPIDASEARPPGAQKRDFMRKLYVGVSRPRHLLCIAMHKDNITDEQIAQLEALGWNVPPALGAEGHG